MTSDSMRSPRLYGTDSDDFPETTSSKPMNRRREKLYRASASSIVTSKPNLRKSAYWMTLHNEETSNFRSEQNDGPGFLGPEPEPPSATSRTFLGDDLRDSLADPARLERAALLLPTLYSQKDPLLRILILELGDFLGCIQVSEHQWEHLIRANFLSTIQEIASDPAYYKPFNAEREHVSESFVPSLRRIWTLLAVCCTFVAEKATLEIPADRSHCIKFIDDMPRVWRALWDTATCPESYNLMDECHQPDIAPWLSFIAESHIDTHKFYYNKPPPLSSYVGHILSRSCFFYREQKDPNLRAHCLNAFVDLVYHEQDDVVTLSQDLGQFLKDYDSVPRYSYDFIDALIRELGRPTLGTDLMGAMLTVCTLVEHFPSGMKMALYAKFGEFLMAYVATCLQGLCSTRDESDSHQFPIENAAIFLGYRPPPVLSC
ncbi:hypothetical protein NLI96_g5077 [Meripilus lineatus]|uniref:Uncharacterized protein n=1 Tax=Meripilus lineatus TaxID=2056292 RepID=A0AAD5V3M3_9APHY|nr:hypothetical protein NLI96_g5077 [Physisporinus lineatus]